MGKKRQSDISNNLQERYLHIINIMNYSLILKEVTERFYTQPILAIIQFIAILLGIKYCWKEKIGRLFVLFFVFDLIVLLVDFSLVGNKNFSKTEMKNFITTTNTLLTIFEINIYYYYYKLTLTSKKIKSHLSIIPILYTILALLHTITMFKFSNLSRHQVSYIIYSLEFLLILPLLITFFNQLIRTNNETPLLSRPSFWISVGIFFQCIISIPCYLIISYLIKQKTEYLPIIEATLFYTPLIINTLFIIKAFLCKKTLTI